VVTPVTSEGIQADDLTGACDAGAQFAARGLATIVLLAGAPWPTQPAAVTVVDTESRGLDPEAARQRAREAGALLARRAGLLYKKVDSTLRGAVAAEIAGMLGGVDLTRVLLAPAFPAQGRTVVDGIVSVHGRPASETAVAREPAFPPTGSSALALLGASGPHPVVALPLALVRRGSDRVRESLERFDGAFVADAETDVDLDTLASAARPVATLFAGSAGLAAALASGLGGDARAVKLVEGEDEAAPGRLGAVRGERRPGSSLLVVAGSAHPATRAQVARFRDRGGSVLEPADADDFEKPGRRAETVERLAAAARASVERHRPGMLLLAGGETAVAVVRALEASGLRLDGEVEPGVAGGRLLDGPFAGLPLVTKAGGFGDPDTLVRLQAACA